MDCKESKGHSDLRISFAFFFFGEPGMARTYYPHIYFEAARPRTRDSVTQAVSETDRRPGVTSFEEYKRVALAQLLDYIDGWTVNHRNDVVPFTLKKWQGRTLVLIRLGKMKWPRKYQKIVDLINHYRRRISKTKSLRIREKLGMEAARKLGIPEKEAREILRRVRQRKFG